MEKYPRKYTFKAMVAKAVAMGWALVLGEDEKPKKYICQHCLKLATERQAKGVAADKATANKELLRKAALVAVMFTKPTGERMLVHHSCPGTPGGWCKVEERTITEATVPTNPVTAAAKGMVMASRKAKKKAAKKAASAPKQTTLC